ncbi:hypothetical protein ABW21_db0208433 [Orbilia brochopaga]|nr:hypothetical protein ABW21_db0208433 [Drechslerella brochopaga]
MCGRYAMALGRREIRNALHDAGLEVDEDELDIDRVRQSYNVAPGYYEPIYRAVAADGPADQNDHQAAGAAEAEGGDGVDSDAMDESPDGKSEQQLAGEAAMPTASETATVAGNGDSKVKYVLSPMKWGA